MSLFPPSVMNALPAASVPTPPSEMLKRTDCWVFPLFPPVPSTYPFGMLAVAAHKVVVHPSSVLTTPAGVIIRSLALPLSVT